MADRFPSIEDFDEGQTEVRGGEGPEGVDASDDFLARERAALGDDADQFTAPGVNATRVEDIDEGDLLGGGGDGMTSPGANTHFQSSFPPVDTGNEQVAPGGSITGAGYGQSASVVPEEEPEVIKEWRARRDLALQHRAEQAENKKQETIKNAQTAVDNFYENYNTKKEKGIAQTRKEAETFLANRDDTTSGGTSWERIGKLVDLSGKGNKGGAAGTGKEKFRELLTNLRKDKDAPGASGV